MTLQQRTGLLVELGKYIENNSGEWQQAKQLAYQKNPWFIPEFVETASRNIASEYLDQQKLEVWIKHYKLPSENGVTKTVGLVMAGNIPMVGFHDMLSIFIVGHRQLIKLSAKDDVLVKHLVKKLCEWNSEVSELISFAEVLKDCDAYIATGSNNTGRYFDYYFGKYPSIIRRNRTSVAILDGNETPEQLALLAKDIQQYFGLGCRNVTKLYVPRGYDFIPLLNALKAFDHYIDHHKYKHNYDFQLALLMMGRKFYMTNESILLTEAEEHFTAVSRLNYQYYDDKNALLNSVQSDDSVQCIVAKEAVPFGHAQRPSLMDYADGVDTIKFLQQLQ